MKTKKTYEEYEIYDCGGLKIHVKRNVVNGKLTIVTHCEDTDFNFIESKPDMVKKVATLLLEASKL